MKAALYARVTWNEHKASIKDQLRECRSLCSRQGFDVDVELFDRELSGNETNRPGYQRLLRSAREHAFDVVVAHELCRLWRNEAEMHQVTEELEYLNIHVVTDDGIDTRIAGMGLLIAIKRAMAKQELHQIAHRTHRALKGRALEGKSAGGRCYGYRPVPHGSPGEREIDDAQAAAVRHIFEWYAAGKSPRRIAERLNEEGVPSPGSQWRRTQRRQDGKWLASAIYGDPKYGSGILNNEIYIGRYIWNRRRGRKKLRSGDREFLLRPSDEWIVVPHPEFRIVSNELWGKVKARQREQAIKIGERVRRGLAIRKARATGAYPKYLFSGLLKCGVCGSNLVISGARQGYFCASRANGGSHACRNELRLPRIRLERALLKWIREILTGDVAGQRVRHAWRALIDKDVEGAECRIASGASPLQELRDEISNLVDAIAHSGLQSSAALAQRLLHAESKLSAMEQEGIVHLCPSDVSPPRPVQFYEAFIATMSRRFKQNARETKSILRELLGGDIVLMASDDLRELVVSCALSDARLPLTNRWPTRSQRNQHRPQPMQAEPALNRSE